MLTSARIVPVVPKVMWLAPRPFSVASVPLLHSYASPLFVVLFVALVVASVWALWDVWRRR